MMAAKRWWVFKYPLIWLNLYTHDQFSIYLLYFSLAASLPDYFNFIYVLPYPLSHSFSDKHFPGNPDYKRKTFFRDP